MMDVLPLCPTQAGYTAAFRDGAVQIALDGGLPRTRRGLMATPNEVTVQWVVGEADYALLVGFYRRLLRRGLPMFLADLILDSPTRERYQAVLRSGTFQLVSKQGGVFTVTAGLLVMPLARYEDPETDPYETVFDLLPYYGSAAAVAEMMNRLEHLVNVDWPHER